MKCAISSYESGNKKHCPNFILLGGNCNLCPLYRKRVVSFVNFNKAVKVVAKKLELEIAKDIIEAGDSIYFNLMRCGFVKCDGFSEYNPENQKATMIQLERALVEKAMEEWMK